MLVKRLCILFTYFYSLCRYRQIICSFRLVDRCNIRFLSSLSDILVFSVQVLAYSSSATCCTSILALYQLKVFALAFLRKGNTSTIFKAYNATIKLKVVGKSKVFTLFSYKLSFLKLYLFLFSKTFVSYKKRIISLKANDAKQLIAIEETRIIS